MPYDPISQREKERLGRLMLDLRKAMMVGGQAPITENMWMRHRRPVPGDWVIETSTLSTLILRPGRWTPEVTSDLWDGQFTRYLRSELRTHLGNDDETWSEEVHVCENPDGTEYAWTNAELAVAPLDASLDAPVAP